MSNDADGSDQARESGLPRILLRLMAFVLVLETILFIAAGRLDWVGGLFAVLLVVRTALEDRGLQEEYEGYKAYARMVRHRPIPYIW